MKRLVGHGNWLPWLEKEFGWTEQTALNFIRVHKFIESVSNSDSKSVLDLVLNFPVSSIYLLAAPSTPTEARDAIIERARAGETVSVAEAKQVIETTKARKRPVTTSIDTFEENSGDITTSVDTTREDIGQTSAGETERKLARLEELERENHRLKRENIGLRSELDELRAAVRAALKVAVVDLSPAEVKAHALLRKLARRASAAAAEVPTEAAP